MNNIIKESYSKIKVNYINKNWTEYTFTRQGKKRVFRIKFSEPPFGAAYEIKKIEDKNKRIKLTYLTINFKLPPIKEYFKIGSRFRHIEEEQRKLEIDIEFQYK